MTKTFTYICASQHDFANADVILLYYVGIGTYIVFVLAAHVWKLLTV